jgi:D-alanyl-D-alanine carboxypeptidase
VRGRRGGVGEGENLPPVYTGGDLGEGKPEASMVKQVAHRSRRGSVVLAVLVLAGGIAVGGVGGAVEWEQGGVRGQGAPMPEAQPEAPQPLVVERDLTGLLEPLRVKAKLPALGAIVVKDGRVAAAGMTGVRKAGGEVPAELDDTFHLGSNTKAMTALLAARLVEQGTLSWQTTVGEVLRATNPGMHEGWDKVTLLQLLRNRGGFAKDVPPLLWRSLWREGEDPVEQRARLVAGVTVLAPIAAPGEKFEYSNTGFAVAGAMMETRTKTPWEELMRVHVFAPLKMESAGFGAPAAGEDGDAPRQPWGHTPNGKPVGPGPRADNPAAIAPAGRAHMNLRDWTKYITLHLRGDARNPAREAALVSAEAFDLLHEPAGEYACGWGVARRAWAKGDRDGDTGVTLTHAGSNTMWYSVVWMVPEKDFAVLVVTNQGGDAAQRATDEAVGKILAEIGTWR